MKKVTWLLMGVIFFSGLHSVFASLTINEIMYAPGNGSDYEWVEIFNSGSSPIDLDNYRFFHGPSESSSTSGPLSLRNGTTTILQPSEYAIIGKSPSVVTDYTWLNFSGMILSASTVSLPDSGDNTYIAISDPNKTVLDYVKYDPSLGGSKDSGTSLSKINNIWSGATPTPGITNEIITSLSSPTASTSSSSSYTSSGTAGTTTETKIKIVEEPKIKTQITAKNLVFAGIPLSFQGTAFGYNNEKLQYGKYFWNFGDGDSKELKASDINMQKFTHTYFYPGEYNVNLEYYSNYYGDTPDASAKMTIKVVGADLLISAVGNEKDFFVELSNNTNYDADISNWILVSSVKNFTFPKNTIINSKKKMTISSNLTHFSIEDKNTLKLLNSQRELIFDYSASIIVPVVAVVAKTSNKNVEKTVEPKISISQDLEVIKPIPIVDRQIPVENLTASVVESNIIKDNPIRTYFLTTILTVFLGISAGTVYFIRQRKTVSKLGDDFKILDE
ncbi:lamin tail domain-containing protein [Candidatus Nomurabacteria bacterium]|nr:lamin tail domain-containing protein [Candidatus Nomurabacteria bacterium]